MISINGSQAFFDLLIFSAPLMEAIPKQIRIHQGALRASKKRGDFTYYDKDPKQGAIP